MLNWIVIAILIFLVFAFIRFKHIKHKIFTVLLIIFVLLFYVTMSQLVSKAQANLTTFDGIVQVLKIYFSWLFTVFSNMQQLAGQAVNADWQGNLTGAG